jgi:manganese transport protein
MVPNALDVAFRPVDPAGSDDEALYHYDVPGTGLGNSLGVPAALNDARGSHREITWKGILAHLGPAFLVSVGYLDPGNWATDIEGGSRFGYELLWVLVMANLMALLLQTLAARMGIVTQAHLSEICRDEYPRAATYLLWFLAELAIIATDLTEVLGTAIGLNLLFKIPLMVGVVPTALDTFILLAAQHQGMRRVEQVMFFFLGVISVCFIAELFMSRPSAAGIAWGLFVPQLNRESLYVAIGIIGATVMPHNFYLHSALVIARVPDRHPDTLRSECKYTLIDTAVALNAALFINCAILIIAAANFWTKGFEVTTLANAYHLLENTGFTLGKVEVAPLLFGIALIAAGQSSTLCGTLAGQYVMEGFLDIRAPPVIRRLVTRLIAIVPAMIVISATGDKGTYKLLIMSQVVLSLQLPFAIVPMIRFTNSHARMKEFANSRVVAGLAWFTAGITVFLNIALVLRSIFDAAMSDSLLVRILGLGMALPVFTLLMAFLGWIAFRKEKYADVPTYRLEDDNDFLFEEMESIDDEVHSTFSAHIPDEDVDTPIAAEVRIKHADEHNIAANGLLGKT